MTEQEKQYFIENLSEKDFWELLEILLTPVRRDKK